MLYHEAEHFTMEAIYLDGVNITGFQIALGGQR